MKAYSVGNGPRFNSPPNGLAGGQLERHSVYSGFSQMPPSGSPPQTLSQFRNNDSKSVKRAYANQQRSFNQEQMDNLHRYQVEQGLRPVKQVPVLLPDGRTVINNQSA